MSSRQQFVELRSPAIDLYAENARIEIGGRNHIPSAVVVAATTNAVAAVDSVAFSGAMSDLLTETEGERVRQVDIGS